jgi:hypothetical protein
MMLIETPKIENCSLVTIQDFYSEEELKLIWQELEFLTSKGKLLSAENTESAVSPEGNFKSNVGLFLDNVYLNRNISNILRINRKIFEETVVEKLTDINPIFRALEHSNADHTLISYYENGDSYFEHPDHSVLTILSYFFKEPKKFLGGELVLTDFNLEIIPKNNMVVIFPGAYHHKVNKVSMDSEVTLSGDGRYCMSQFINYRPMS